MEVRNGEGENEGVDEDGCRYVFMTCSFVVSELFLVACMGWLGRWLVFAVYIECMGSFMMQGKIVELFGLSAALGVVRSLCIIEDLLRRRVTQI